MRFMKKRGKCADAVFVMINSKADVAKSHQNLIFVNEQLVNHVGRNVKDKKIFERS
jgi:hypothetical protein